VEKIRLSDGIEFETTGDYHLTHRHDGWYVVGKGMLCPVRGYDEGQQVIAEMRSIDRLKNEAVCD